MDNLKLPAYPGRIKIDETHKELIYEQIGDGNIHQAPGFTKLEKAALMIAAGMVKEVYTDPPGTAQIEYVAGISVQIAKHVLIEANK